MAGLLARHTRYVFGDFLDFFRLEDFFFAERGHPATTVDHLVFDDGLTRRELVEIGTRRTRGPGRRERVTRAAIGGEDFHPGTGGRRGFRFAPFFAFFPFFGGFFTFFATGVRLGNLEVFFDDFAEFFSFLGRRDLPFGGEFDRLQFGLAEFVRDLRRRGLRFTFHREDQHPRVVFVGHPADQRHLAAVVDGDVLLAVGFVGDRGRVEVGRALVGPQFLARFGIEGGEFAVIGAGEDKASGGRRRTAAARAFRRVPFVQPFGGVVQHVDGGE